MINIIQNAFTKRRKSILAFNVPLMQITVGLKNLKSNSQHQLLYYIEQCFSNLMHLDHLEGLLKQIPGPTPRASDSVGLRICISNKLPHVDADAGDHTLIITTIEELRKQEILKGLWLPSQRNLLTN